MAPVSLFAPQRIGPVTVAVVWTSSALWHTELTNDGRNTFPAVVGGWMDERTAIHDAEQWVAALRKLQEFPKNP